MGLVFKLNYQVQQLELYVVNSAYFLLCSAQGEMGKMQTQAQEGLMWMAFLLEGLAQWRVTLWTCCLLMCGSCAMWKITSRSNFAQDKARIRPVKQESRECFLPCHLVSTCHCQLLAPVRWKQWWTHIDPRMMLHFLLGNCCRTGKKAHRQLLQEHFSSSWISSSIHSANAGNPTCNLKLRVSLLSLLTSSSTSEAVIAVSVAERKKQ